MKTRPKCGFSQAWRYNNNNIDNNIIEPNYSLDKVKGYYLGEEKSTRTDTHTVWGMGVVSWLHLTDTP
jgi:hypothetical protein